MEDVCLFVCLIKKISREEEVCSQWKKLWLCFLVINIYYHNWWIIRRLITFNNDVTFTIHDTTAKKTKEKKSSHRNRAHLSK